MLMDYDNELLFDYQRVGEATTLFPLAYLIDTDGIIANIYVNSEPSVEELLAAINKLLP